MNYNNLQRGKLKARKVIREWGTDNNISEGDLFFKKLIHTRKMCNGLCCANPKKYNPKNLTKQERIANIRMKEQLEEIGLEYLLTEP